MLTSFVGVCACLKAKCNSRVLAVISSMSSGTLPHLQTRFFQKHVQILMMDPISLLMFGLWMSFLHIPPSLSDWQHVYNSFITLLPLF